WRDVVNEFVALALRHPARSCGWLAGRRTRLYPRLPAIVRSLQNLAEPAAGLRRINAVRFGGRSLHVLDLPAGKMRTAHFPVFPLSILVQNEPALARSNQPPYSAPCSPLNWPVSASSSH